MTDLLYVFVAGFFSVFAMGFQSRNVNAGHYGWAAGTSFAIGISQTLIWVNIVKDPSLAAALVYGLSGALAITSSMYVHQRFVQKKAPDA